jgi:Flp pilus assembly protein TadG
MIDPGRQAQSGRSFLRLWLRKAARGVSDDKGAVLIEGAIILPILLTIFFGMVEFSNAFTAKRRVNNVATATADLVARAQSVTMADLADIARVGAQLMQPFSSTGLTLRISSVSEDSQSRITEQWNCFWSSISVTPTCTQTGAVYTGAPAGVLRTGQSIIISNASYAFTPPVGQFLLGGVTFTASSYFRPRLAVQVPLQ